MHLPENIRRLFLAIDAPNEASEFIRLNQNIFPHQKKLKWMRLQNLHLSIYFIGNIDAKKYEEVFNLSKEIISGYSSFTLMPEKFCLMPSQHPRMIWIKYYTHPIFTAINHALHQSLKKFELQNNPIYPKPIPHITLARFYGLKENINLSQLNEIALQPLAVKEIKMWETISSEGSSDYTQNKESLFLK
ncbi:MAG: RNA 2',3'-cyclic phosphodiesterase [Bacteroidia bacterium]|nr:MAG: RNA 2',3'-cyclic phosphodiesterase [Bacteroidia bacterium]